MHTHLGLVLTWRPNYFWGCMEKMCPSHVFVRYFAPPPPNRARRCTATAPPRRPAPQPVYLFFAAFILAGFFLFSTTSTMNLAVLESVPPANRPFAIAFSTLLMHLLGERGACLESLRVWWWDGAFV